MNRKIQNGYFVPEGGVGGIGGYSLSEPSNSEITKLKNYQ